MAKLRTLFFDMDQTLARDSHSTRLSGRRVIPIIQAKVPHKSADEIEAIYRSVNTSHWEDFDHSPLAKIECSLEARALIWRDVLLRLEIEDNELTLQIAQKFQSAREETYELYDDTASVLKQLKQKFTLILVTNGHSQMQRKKIEVAGIEPFFEHIFIAQEVGSSKPHAPIFEKALEAANAQPHEAMMVGDHPDKDINGPKKLGIHTTWIKRFDSRKNHQDPKATHSIENLEQLLTILKEHYA